MAIAVWVPIFQSAHPEMVMKMKNQAADFICAKYNWDEVVDKTLALYGEKSR